VPVDPRQVEVHRLTGLSGLSRRPSTLTRASWWPTIRNRPRRRTWSVISCGSSSRRCVTSSGR